MYLIWCDRRKANNARSDSEESTAVASAEGDSEGSIFDVIVREGVVFLALSSGADRAVGSEGFYGGIGEEVGNGDSGAA